MVDVAIDSSMAVMQLLFHCRGRWSDESFPMGGMVCCWRWSPQNRYNGWFYQLRRKLLLLDFVRPSRFTDCATTLGDYFNEGARWLTLISVASWPDAGLFIWNELPIIRGLRISIWKRLPSIFPKLVRISWTTTVNPNRCLLSVGQSQYECWLCFQSCTEFKLWQSRYRFLF